MSKWGKRDSAASVVLASFAVVSGVASLGFAACNNTLGAIVALALSLFCGALSTGLMALKFSARRTHMEMQTRVVEDTLNYLLDAVNREPSSGDQHVAERAELVDRIHRLASQALEDSARSR